MSGVWAITLDGRSALRATEGLTDAELRSRCARVSITSAGRTAASRLKRCAACPQPEACALVGACAREGRGNGG